MFHGHFPILHFVHVLMCIKLEYYRAHTAYEYCTTGLLSKMFMFWFMYVSNNWQLRYSSRHASRSLYHIRLVRISSTTRNPRSACISTTLLTTPLSPKMLRFCRKQQSGYKLQAIDTVPNIVELTGYIAYGNACVILILYFPVFAIRLLYTLL